MQGLKQNRPATRLVNNLSFVSRQSPSHRPRCRHVHTYRRPSSNPLVGSAVAASAARSRRSVWWFCGDHEPRKHGERGCVTSRPQDRAVGLDNAASVSTSAPDGCKSTASSLCTTLGVPSHTQWDPCLAPSFTSQLPLKGKELTGC